MKYLKFGTQEPGKIYFVLEFCKGGDLSMFLHKRKGRITESTAKHFMLQLGIIELLNKSIKNFLVLFLSVSHVVIFQDNLFYSIWS